MRTLLGRLRRLPDLRSKNFPVRMEAERQAMNTPVQGSAADLIKQAMIDLHRELARRELRSRLILQIHDELLLEVPESEAEQARALVQEVMEGALKLDVPLVADAKLGTKLGRRALTLAGCERIPRVPFVTLLSVSLVFLPFPRSLSLVRLLCSVSFYSVSVQSQSGPSVSAPPCRPSSPPAPARRRSASRSSRPTASR